MSKFKHTTYFNVLSQVKKEHTSFQNFFLNSNYVQSNIYRNAIQLSCIYIYNMLSAAHHLAITRYHGLSMNQKNLCFVQFSLKLNSMINSKQNLFWSVGERGNESKNFDTTSSLDFSLWSLTNCLI